MSESTMPEVSRDVAAGTFLFEPPPTVGWPSGGTAARRAALGTNIGYLFFTKMIPAEAGLLELQELVQIQVFSDHEGFFTENEELNIYSSGDTLNDAFTEFYGTFAAQWRIYSSTPDDRLTSDALHVKRKFEKIVNGQGS